MLNKLQDFLLNKMAGRLAVRLAASLAMFLASGQLGLAVNVDPAELSALMITGANLLITKLKPRPESPKPDAPEAK